MKKMVGIMGLVLVMVLFPMLIGCPSPNQCTNLEETQRQIDDLQTRVDRLLKEKNISYHDIYMNNPQWGQAALVIFPPIKICNSEEGLDHTIWLMNNTDGVLTARPNLTFKSNYDYYVPITSMDMIVNSEDDKISHKGTILTKGDEGYYEDDFLIMRLGENVGGIDTVAHAMRGGENYQGGFFIDPHNPREFKIHIANIACKSNTSWDVEIMFWVIYEGKWNR